MTATPFHAYYTARILDSLQDDDKFIPTFASSDIKVYPYQVGAALFATRSPYTKGVVLMDESGLGKSTEAISKTADIDIQNAGVNYVETEFRTTDLEDTYTSLPYILGVISEETLIKKSTVAEIIMKSGRAQDFLNNPQSFMEQCLQIIKNNRHALAIDGIKYVKLDGKEYYAQEIFDSSELVANLDKNAVKVDHSVYDHIIYDSSTIEKPFALALDNDPDVKMFFKIPDRFKIDTPIGTYNPDWAVLWEKNGEQKLYFILETKGSTSLFDLRTPEQLKIHCGMEHFKALDNGLEMHVASDWNKFKVNQ